MTMPVDDVVRGSSQAERADRTSGEENTSFPSVKACFDARDQARCLAMTYGPKYLRFFQARFEPL